MDADERQRVREGIAKELGIALYRQYGEEQTAAFIGIDHSTLKKHRRAGKVPYINLGQRKVRFFGYMIADILIDGIGEKWENTTSVNLDAETIGSVKGETPQAGSDAGMTTPPDKLGILALARRTLSKPSKS